MRVVRREYYAPLFISACALVWYAWVAFQTGFLGDDLRYLYEIEQRPSWEERIEYIIKPLGTAFVWRPLINASWLAEYLLFGRSSIGYHLSNLFLYASTAWLLFFIFSRFTQKYVAAWAATIFLFLPFHYEVAVWLSGRTDALAFFLALSSIALFILFRERKRKIFFLLSLLSYFFALCAKEMALFTPFLILFLDGVVYRRARIRSLFFITTAYACAVALYLGLRFSVLGSVVSADPSLSTRFLVSPTFFQFKALIHRSLLLFNESMLKEVASFLASLWSAWHVKVIIFFTGLLCVMQRKNISRRTFVVPALFGVLLFLLFSLPVLPLISDVTRELKHSRFLYAPSAGSALILALLLFSSHEGRIGKWFILGMRGSIGVILLSALLLNSLPWIRAGQAVAQTVGQLDAFEELWKPSPPRTLLAHRVKGEVQGAYIFHDPFSFSQAAQMHLNNPSLRIFSVGAFPLPQSPFCQTSSREDILLEWRNDRFVRDDKTLERWRVALEQKNDIGFETYDQFIYNGWRTHDLRAQEEDGFVSLTRTGSSPSLELIFSQPLQSHSFRTFLLEFSKSSSLPFTLVWNTATMDRYHPFNQIRTEKQQLHQIMLCNHPNFAVSSPLTSMMIRFPSSFQKAIIQRLHLRS